MNPLRWFAPRVPTALQLAVAELEEAQRMKLDQSGKREYHAAMEDMLHHRIDRLRLEIALLAEDGS